MIVLSIKESCHNCPDFETETFKEILYGSDVDAEVNIQISCTHRGLCDRIRDQLKDEMRKETKDNVPGTTDTA